MRCGCRSHGGFLTSRGLREVAQRSLEGLEVADMGLEPYLDKVGSVSAPTVLELHWDDDIINQQYRRFLNGS